MIPPQVNGATFDGQLGDCFVSIEFPMIPPQVNGATNVVSKAAKAALEIRKFPMIPPQVNGAT